MKHPMGVRILTVSAALLASCATRTPSGACGAEPCPAPGAAGIVSDGTVAQGAVTVAATVVRVDPKKRLVTLETPDGRRVTARVHARVKDLERLRAGDTVSATYYESLAYDVRAPGAVAPGNAAPAPLPGTVDTRVVTVTSRITAVDRPAGTLTLQAPDADPVTVHVKDPAALARVKVGDLVDVTLTEAVAVAIEGVK
jgi:translation initiation factor IF-1